MTLFGEHARFILRLAKLTQKDAAARLGISQQYLCDVINGRRHPTPRLADGFAALERDLAYPSDAAHLHRMGARDCGWNVAA